MCTFVTGLLALGVILCNTTGEGRELLTFSLYYTMTEVPNEKLSPWYFTVRYASLVIQQRIAENTAHGLDSAYDEHNLKQLTDMEQFFKMSWDTWMDDLAATIRQEVK